MDNKKIKLPKVKSLIKVKAPLGIVGLKNNSSFCGAIFKQNKISSIVDDNYYGTKGQQEINRGDDGNVHAIILVSSTLNPANRNDITEDTQANRNDIAEDTPVEKIHEVASKITDANVVLDILNNIASGNVNLSDEKKQQIVHAIMEYSPVMADKNQEIKNQDAASQAEGTAAPLENASNYWCN